MKILKTPKEPIPQNPSDDFLTHAPKREQSLIGAKVLSAIAFIALATGSTAETVNDAVQDHDARAEHHRMLLGEAKEARNQLRERAPAVETIARGLKDCHITGETTTKHRAFETSGQNGAIKRDVLTFTVEADESEEARSARDRYVTTGAVQSFPAEITAFVVDTDGQGNRQLGDLIDNVSGGEGIVSSVEDGLNKVHLYPRADTYRPGTQFAVFANPSAETRTPAGDYSVDGKVFCGTLKNVADPQTGSYEWRVDTASPAFEDAYTTTGILPPPESHYN